MYSRRSACSGSESLCGFILLPQSHTLLREDVMLDDSWISAWSGRRNVTFERKIPLPPLNKSPSVQVMYETWLYSKVPETSCLPQALSGLSYGPGAPSCWRPGSCLSAVLRPKLEIGTPASCRKCLHLHEDVSPCFPSQTHNVEVREDVSLRVLLVNLLNIRSGHHEQLQMGDVVLRSRSEEPLASCYSGPTGDR